MKTQPNYDPTIDKIARNRFGTTRRIACALFVAALIGSLTGSGTPVLAGSNEAEREATTEASELMRTGALALQNSGYEQAAVDFERASGKLRKTWFDDDAALARILALAAIGNDEKADELHRKNSRKFASGPLASEAGLAQAWNQFRREEFDASRSTLDELLTEFTWLRNEGRIRTLAAALILVDDDPAAALERLAPIDSRGDAALPALGLLLVGQCYERLGDERQAALVYQSLLNQHTVSPLRGYALLAKGRIYELAEDYRDAVVEFDELSTFTSRDDLRAEVRFLSAACRFLGGDRAGGINAMAAVAKSYPSEDSAARAFFALGEMRWLMGDYEVAISRFNQVLAGYFDHELAGSARYRMGRCLDALGRTEEANSAYQAVAAGHPYAPEAPAAVYLAGVGLLEQGNPRAAAPYFQLVMDRYAGHGSAFVFTSPEHQELVEASLCLLEYSYYESDQLGLMSGGPHVALQKMPPSGSVWRAYALLLDADALAAQARFPEAQASLDRLLNEFPDHTVGIRANRLLAWTYARQGREDLAIETERTMLARYSAQDDEANLSAAQLTMAHSLFNAKDFDGAAAQYSEFLRNYPNHTDASSARYQQGLSFQRLGRDGDAVDAWQRITEHDPGSEAARKAWLRSGDVYFQAGHLADARRCFGALMNQFPAADAQAAALLRLGRCDFNEGQSKQALARFQGLRTQYPDSPESFEVEQDLTQVLYGLGLGGEPEYLQQLASEHPSSPLAPEARFELAMAQYEAENFVIADRLFSDLVGRYPDYSAADRASFLAVDSCEQTGNAAEARSGWIRFLEYFPNSELAPTALFRVASIRFEDGEYLQAAQDFETVLQAEATDEIHAAALYNLALCRRIRGEHDSADRALRDYRARDFESTARDVEIARMMGEIHEQAARFAEAADEYRRAVELGAVGSDAAELNYLAGVCLEQAGDRRGALGSFELSIACDDKANPFRLSALAQTAALREEGEAWDLALAAYRDLIENASDPTLVGAATERVNELESALGH